MARYWVKVESSSAKTITAHIAQGVTAMSILTADQIKKQVQDLKDSFSKCADQIVLENRLTAMVNQYNHDQDMVQRIRSIAGQIKPTLPIKVVTVPTTTGPKEKTLKSTRPTDLDPQVWQVWATLPVETARGNLARWRTLLVRHDSTGNDKSVHGEYRKGSDGKEYFYAAPKEAHVKTPRTSKTPAQEVVDWRAAEDKSGIVLTSPAYDLLSRKNERGENERSIYAAAQLKRLAAKKAAKKNATVPATTAAPTQTVTTPVAPVQAPVVIPVAVNKGNLKFG
jgi:hypothetical protein